MSQTVLLYSGSKQTASTASTTYFGAWNSEGAFNGTLDVTGTATQQKWYGGAAVVQLLTGVPSSLTRTTDTIATIRQNGAASAVTITFSSGGVNVVKQDTTHSFSIANGDTYDYSIALGTGAGSVGCALTAAAVLASGQGKGACTNWSGAGSAITNSGWFTVGNGSLTRNGVSETNVQNSALEGCTISNLQLYVSANSSAAGMDFLLRKNAADTTLKIAAATIGTGTGLFEDASHSASYVAGDVYNYACGVPSASITLRFASVAYASASGNALQPFACYLLGDGPYNVGSTVYSLPGINVTGATESQNRLVMPVGGPTVVSMLSARCTTSTLSGATGVVRVRKNTANGNSNISFTATGLQQDTTNSDTFAYPDTFGFQYSASGTSGGFTLGWVGALVQAAPAAGSGLLSLGLLGVGS